MPVTSTLRTDSPAAVSVQAPARLHLGFLDPSGTLGRRFGSLGLVIGGPQTQVEITAAAADAVLAATPAAQAEVERASHHLRLLRQHTGRNGALQLRLLQVLPAHAGLGSGTQLALAVGTAFARWHGLDLGSATLAQWLGRGLRSGVGIAGFDHGGLLLDGGPNADGTAAPLLARVDLPAAWRVVLVQDNRHRGLFGSEEKHALVALAALPQHLAADICHQVLMRVLPGAAGAEFATFTAGINRVQQLLGAHFAPAQGGSAYTSPTVGHLLQWMAGAPVPAAIGQSSWGPTGFAILPSQVSAEAIIEAARTAGAIDPALDVRIVAGRNGGASLHDNRRQP